MVQPPTKKRPALSEAALMKELTGKLQAKYNPPSQEYLPYKEIIDYMLQGEGETIQVYQKHLGIPTVEEAYATFFKKYKGDIIAHKQELDQNTNRLMSDLQQNPPMAEATLNPSVQQDLAQQGTSQAPEQFQSQTEEFQDQVVGEMESEQHDFEGQLEEQAGELDGLVEQQQKQYQEQQQRVLQQQKKDEALAKVNSKYQKEIKDINKEYTRRRKNILKGPDMMTKIILWVVFGFMYAVDATIGMLPFIGDVQAYIISMMSWALVTLFVGAGMFTYTALFYAGDLIGGLVLDAVPGLGTAVSVIFDFAYEPGRALLGKAPMQHYRKKYFEGLKQYVSPTPEVVDA